MFVFAVVDGDLEFSFKANRHYTSSDLETNSGISITAQTWYHVGVSLSHDAVSTEVFLWKN